MSIDTPAWVRDAIFYQVFPDRLARSGRVKAPGELEPWEAEPTVDGFKGGDLYGVMNHLDRLQGMGVTALYLNPVFASASNHRYHAFDYYSVDPLLGGDQAMRELLDEAHARGMRVVLDGVFNHSGRGWFPFHHLLEVGARSPYRDWFCLSEDARSGTQPLIAFPSPDLLEQLDPGQPKDGSPRGVASRELLGYEAWWDLPALPKIDLTNSATRAYILDVAEYWVRFGIDGWRLDVPEEVEGEFWREFRARVRAVKRDAYIVGEVWHHKPEWLQGDMFDAFMNYPLTQALLGFAAQGHLDLEGPLPFEYIGKLHAFDGEALWQRLEELDGINPSEVTAVQLNLLGSHDTPRLRTLCGEDLDSVRLATLLQLTLPGAPCIYYGDEIGLSGSMDPACRGAFPDDPAEWKQEPYEWVADLAELRHSNGAFRDAELELLGVQGPAIAYLRRLGADAFAVVANAGDATLEWAVGLPEGLDRAEVIPIRGGAPGVRSAEVTDGSLRVELPARDGMVVRLR